MNRIQLEDRSTLQERVCNSLRRAILKGVFQPGERLVQEDIAAQMGVSRMPVREAFRQLEKEGLIDWVRHRGAVVKAITWQDIEEIYTLRADLEVRAFSLSFQRLTPEDVRVLNQLVIDMDEAIREKDPDRYLEFNIRFHRRLLCHCPWNRLMTYIEQLWNGIPLQTPSFLPGQIPRSHRDHRELAAALERGDKDRACQVLRDHILKSGEMLKNYIQQQG